MFRTGTALEKDPIIIRTVYPEVPPRVEYAMSGLGLDYKNRETKTSHHYERFSFCVWGFAQSPKNTNPPAESSTGGFFIALRHIR